MQTLDEVSAWLDESMASTGTAPAPSLQDDANSKDGDDDKGDDDEEAEEEFKVNLEYKLYVLKPKPTMCNTRNANRRKANTVEPKDKYSKLVSKPGQLFFYWKPSHPSLVTFKRAAIAVLCAKEPDVVVGHTEEQEQEGELSWYAIIQHGGQFVEKNKTDLDNSEIFVDFLEMADCKGGAKIYVVQNDPKLVAEAFRLLSDRNRGSNEALTKPQPTAGAKKNSEILNNMWTIQATHMPCEQLTGSLELPPQLNCPVGKSHGSKQNPEITEHKPPSSPAFTFQTKEEFKASSGACHISDGASRGSDDRGRESSPVNRHQNHCHREGSPPSSRGPRHQRTPPNVSPLTAAYAGMGIGGYIPPPMVWPNSPWAWPGASPQTFQPYPAMPHIEMNSLVPPVPQRNFLAQANGSNPAPASSPPASDVTVDIADYLTFCHINVNCENVQKALAEYGITHYAKFENFEAKEFEELGVKRSHAVSSIKKYERSLKKRH
ncbi:hypothetical protein PTTG_29756 [Puccinia triticina 1-1 BBBD Race 1]|uniref:Uncharacterized protein n=1 Tax=Puccinia triticina (isolate 1-1 / race 1 (BBBD)) TaxID=630390 RepID=A0A180G1Z2_PUCT1|nr:hypothetical protein PTTG_29756 [Puccinia triticina 1-1 BBBD Race 1]